MLYLETGCKPIRFVIMMRQMMFLHYILKEDKSSLISRFFYTQAKKPDKNDWVNTILENLEYLEICLDFEQIEMTSQYQFRNVIENEINKKCFDYLIAEKNKKNKVKHIQYEKLVMQKYLMPGKLSNHQAKEIFLLRNRMLDTKDNFPNKYKDKMCPICVDNSIDSQAHVMLCPSICDQKIVKENLKYENLFKNDIDQQLEVSSIVIGNFKRRKKMIQERTISTGRTK